ncbi:MAG: 3-dehydroquinate synthase [Dehalococcoidales bacterium]|nr:3-dehydroquinate synthase [Dehalococcoidales bacterium]
MRTIEVKLGNNSYEIRVGRGLLSQTGPWLKQLGFSGKLVVITDAKVRELYGKALAQSLEKEGFKVVLLSVPEGEAQKSLGTAGSLYRQLNDAAARRDTPVLALGGGVIGDLAGFVAATYMRGVPLVQVPTTLLAQVDSSIGGKVAVDHGNLKNNIGVFYQPRLVIADIDVLDTLPDVELADGLAEIIKSAAIRDRDFFAFLEANIERIKAREKETLEYVVSRTAGIKAEVVAQDERDTGLRNVLNYGHTIGHAIETVSGFGVGHGEAIAIGMVVAGRIANRLGMLTAEGTERLAALLRRGGLPTKLPGYKIEEIMSAMQHDKKIAQDKLRFVLLRAIGDAVVTEVNPGLVEEVLRANY